MTKVKKDRIERISKPFMRGKMIDRGLPGGALKYFGFMMLMLFVYFMSIMISAMDSGILNVVINGAIIFTTWLIFWQSGMTSGSDAVTQGEIMYQRQEKGRPVADWEAEQCYHPLKGFIVALVGSCLLRIVWIYTIFAMNRTLAVLFYSYPVSWIITCAAHFICYLFVKKKVVSRYVKNV